MQRGVVGWEDQSAHDDVRVAVDVFGDAMHHDVGSEEKGGGVEGGQEGVVYQNEGLDRVGVGQGCDVSYVYDAQRRIGWRLYPNELVT